MDAGALQRAQTAWELRHRIRHARRIGVTLQEISEHIGKDKERVRQMQFQAEKEFKAGWRSPLEVDLAIGAMPLVFRLAELGVAGK